MRAPFLLLAIPLAFALHVHAASKDKDRSDTITRSFTANPGGQLLLKTDRGSITVEGSPGSQVEIVVERRVAHGSNSKAAALLQRHEITFDQQGDTIRVDAKLPEWSIWSWRKPRLEVDFRIRVPQSFDLDCRTAGGAIRVAQLKGDVAIRTAGGSLNLNSVEGTIQGRTSGGSIRAQSLVGSVDLVTSGGSIQLSDVRGEQLRVNTSGGSIRLSNINAPAEVKTSGGSIELDGVTTPVHASTSGGSIRAIFHSVPRDEVSLRTSGGGITVALPEQSAFVLDAETSAGGVRSELPVVVSGSTHRSALRGPVNGGGPTMILRSSAGSIRIKAS